MKKPLVRKRDGSWQLVVPGRQFGFNPTPTEPVVLVSGMPQAADCCSFLRTYSNTVVHEGCVGRGDEPESSGFSGDGYRPVVR